jgi:hypothetical protein
LGSTTLVEIDNVSAAFFDIILQMYSNQSNILI